MDHRRPPRTQMSLAARVLALDAEAVALRGALARAGSPSAASRAPPRRTEQPQPWPLADDPAATLDGLEKYDRRPDDPAIVAARDGAAFLARLEPGMSPTEMVAAAALPGTGHKTPEISVIVPVYGQLRWTLNCLHGLLGHATRRTFQVIVVDDASPDGSGDALAALAATLPGLTVLRQRKNAGFIAACNEGGAAAQGDLLVLLNNDTRVVEGWLDALTDSFALFPKAGLVGSKFLYPDGRLQEAGGIIWRDGSAWNVGRGEDPNQPAHCHARQVDYVSGASIAIPHALWRDLGGLDAHFAPAYGEDADLALRVRAAGREVWFQPASRVVHYEGRTSGTDTASGAKAYQVGNLKKLFVRWHGVLARHGRHGEDPYFERERNVVRRALVVEATTPTPNQDAGSGVATETMRLLQDLGYKVHFVAQDNFLFQPGPTGALQRLSVECGYAPYDIGFADYIARHGALFDVVLVFRPGVLEATEALIRRHAPQAALVFSNADLHFLRLERAAALAGDPAATSQAAAAKQAELALLARADVTMTLSTFERDLLARDAPKVAVTLQPFPFARIGTTAGFEARRDVCFLGGYGHAPNVDAATHLVREILPLLRRHLPGARVVLAGANPTDAVRALAAPDVIVPGLIDDLATLFDAARVFVCPLRIGAGVKGKVIAAMAHGLPVVATSIGAEGMDVVDGRDLLVADGAEAFAAACARLHDDPALWGALSASGLDYVGRACSADAGARALSDAIDTAWRRKLGLA